MAEKARKRDPHLKFTVKQVESALVQSAGMKSHAARILEQMTGRHCSHQTVSNYLERYPELKTKLDEIFCRTDDRLEAEFLRRALNGSDALLLHIVKTRLRYRGYGDRLDVSGEMRHSGEVTMKHYSRADIEAMSPADRASAYRDMTRGEARIIDLPPPSRAGRPKKDVA